MAKLYDSVLKLKQDTSSLTNNWFLLGMDLSDFEKLDHEHSRDDKYLKKAHKKISSIISKISINHVPGWLELYNVYHEYKTYQTLNKYYVVESVPETEEGSPDFRIIYEGVPYYVECKALSHFDPNEVLKKDQEEAFEGKYQIEKQLSEGAKYGSALRTFNPFGNRLEDSGSVLEYTNLVLRKIDQNYKAKQYEYGETILFIDLRLLGMPMRGDDAIRRTAIFQKPNTTGVLWAMCCGKIGDEIYGINKNEDWTLALNGKMDRNGILYWHKNLCGVSFNCGLHQFYNEIYSITKSGSETYRICEKFSRHVIDEESASA